MLKTLNSENHRYLSKSIKCLHGTECSAGWHSGQQTVSRNWLISAAHAYQIWMTCGTRWIQTRVQLGQKGKQGTHVPLLVSYSPVELFAIHDKEITIRGQNSAFRCNCSGSADIVPGNHSNCDSSTLTLEYSRRYLESNSIEESWRANVNRSKAKLANWISNKARCARILVINENMAEFN